MQKIGPTVFNKLGKKMGAFDGRYFAMISDSKNEDMKN